MSDKKFLVAIREVHVQQVEVEASSPNEAKELVAGGVGNYLDDRLEYSHILDPDLWTVEERI